jgi:putative RNA 2'-phosphotransferase
MDTTQISKFISYVLRHRPDSIGIQLDAQGWVSVEELIEKACRFGNPLDLATLLRVVRENDKQRFVISKDGTKIRANQGHSIPVDLGLSPQQPPQILYHGTAKRFLENILLNGLHPASRHDVHLSVSFEAAIKVGKRHGAPVVLEIASGKMHVDGYPFYVSGNGVWLTKHVPPLYLKAFS